MINRVWSDLPNFKTTVFLPNFNCVIADQAEESSEKESTNGLGKTTLIRIIQFCLGGDLSRDKVLNHKTLRGVTFGLDFEHLDNCYTVSRSTRSDGKKVNISKVFIHKKAVEKEEQSEDDYTISLDDWKTILSSRFLLNKESDQDSTADYASVTFRELSYYFMRIGKSAFNDPRQTYSGQSARKKQICISYLLSLNWQTQEILHRKKAKQEEISKAIKVLESAEGEEVESIGDMEAERVVLEAEIEEKTREFEQFNVLDDYTELEAMLGDVDRKLSDEINENHADRKLLEHYQSSSADEPEADSQRPLRILTDAGALFKEDALKKIEQVADFHERLYRNRKVFLNSEISRLKKEIKIRKTKIESLADRKTEILKVLDQSGAFESFTLLQRKLTEMNGALASLKARIDGRKSFDRKKDDLAREISEGRTVLKNDLEDRREIVDEAVSLFAEYTNHLYGKPAKLGIDVMTTGYRFKVTIDRDGSEGVEQMSIFCFDLMIATLRARRNFPFRTLIHDSTLFADVDSRQYGAALQLAKKESESEGFQYICCLNAGTLPMDHLGDLDLDLDSYIRLRLTDGNDKTRLLGKKLAARETS